MWLDASANGSLMDEATLITAVAGVAFGLVKIFQQSRKNQHRIDEVVDTLNRVDEEPEPGQTPSLGQRVVRIERQVDSINANLLDLSSAMTEHIQWEQKKIDRIDERITQVEDAIELKKKKPAPKATTRVRKTAG